MSLDIQAIAQAQMAKFLVAEFTGQKAARLVAELCDAFPYQRFVDCVIPIHRWHDTSGSPWAANYRKA
jgi:hypothetical protein